jgi:hypothetical protein
MMMKNMSYDQEEFVPCADCNHGVTTDTECYTIDCVVDWYHEREVAFKVCDYCTDDVKTLQECFDTPCL